MKKNSTSNIEALEILLAETEAAIAQVNRMTGPVPALDGHFGTEATVSTSQQNASSTEITIDLPHGQTLTVRGLDEGSVVEIASWVGDGPPDETAVRMLFGATRNNQSHDAQEKKLASESFSDFGIPEASAPESIDSGFDQQRRSRDRQAVKGTTMGKKLGILGGILALGALIIVALRLTNLVLFEHPTGGLAGGLGPASSTVVAVSPSAVLERNASVLVVVDDGRFVAGVIEVGVNDVLVFTGDGQKVVPIDDVLGRVLFVVPFIGSFSG